MINITTMLRTLLEFSQTELRLQRPAEKTTGSKDGDPDVSFILARLEDFEDSEELWSSYRKFRKELDKGDTEFAKIRLNENFGVFNKDERIYLARTYEKIGKKVQRMVARGVTLKKATKHAKEVHHMLNNLYFASCSADIITARQQTVWSRYDKMRKDSQIHWGCYEDDDTRAILDTADRLVLQGQTLHIEYRISAMLSLHEDHKLFNLFYSVGEVASRMVSDWTPVRKIQAQEYLCRATEYLQEAKKAEHWKLESNSRLPPPW